MATVLRNFITGTNFDYISASQLPNQYADYHYNTMGSGSMQMVQPDYNASTDGYQHYLTMMTTGGFGYISAAMPDYNAQSDGYVYYENMLKMGNMTYFIPSGSTSTSGSGGGGGAGVTVRYKMRGYRVATAAFEYWIATDPNAPPPSGNTLIDITIAQVLSNI